MTKVVILSNDLYGGGIIYRFLDQVSENFMYNVYIKTAAVKRIDLDYSFTLTQITAALQFHFKVDFII